MAAITHSPGLPEWPDLLAVACTPHPEPYVGADAKMAHQIKDRLAKMDSAIDLLQGIRRETAELYAELFPRVSFIGSSEQMGNMKELVEETEERR